MTTLLLLIAALSLSLTIAVSLEAAMGLRRMTHIKDVPALRQKNIPQVSVVIPACNEAATIEPALRSVLSLAYENLEVLVVNDRSIDGTGKVLKRMQAEFPKLRLLHVTDLPPGWLGKNYALHCGAEQASGDYLLFTDADIIFEKSALARAMQHMHETDLDHMSMVFENTAPGGLLNALFLDVGGALLLLFKPWKAKEEKSRHYMGVGAFNLVKTSAYKTIGGHRRIAMHPIDDIMLGRIIKQNGFRQDCLLGNGFVTVKWYTGVRELINGVMKNTFALFNYRVSLVLAGVLFVFLLTVLPFWAFFFTRGITRIFFGAAVLVRFLSFAKGFLDAGINPVHAIWAPLTPYIGIYIVFKAAAVTIKNNGIDWRGTHYSLKELKRNRP